MWCRSVAAQTVNNNNTANAAGLKIPNLTFADFYSSQPIVAANTSGATCSFGLVAKVLLAAELHHGGNKVTNTYVQEYNFAAQHQFGNKLSLDAAYVSNRTVHIV